MSQRLASRGRAGAGATRSRSRRGTYFRLWWMWCTTHVCTTVAGKMASIASGNPFRPSTQQMRMSQTPRCLSSASTSIQSFAPSVS
jgi:hypothetical protein